MMDDQADWVCAIETGRSKLPSDPAMRAAIAAERRSITRLYPDSPRYGLELDPREYRRALAATRKMEHATGK
jgi:dimethylaniline monooxygenase (N-oxide forming)